MAEVATAGLRAPAERGALRIADRALARIAARAAHDTLAAAWAGRAGQATTTARVSIAASGRGTRLTLGLDLPYPADLAALAQTVRAAVSEQVAALTGTRVAEVVVLVERLAPVEVER
ncbi:hypothetical protein [Kitasatospora sp. GP82]|uniref:hypothetical protein n=1 Tax=Kitasatospora sp. GP82 TaxID=3035089 RepID=UPI002474385F|nr:hypothetical protein [Kitasatospora sp. GP82]MDH6129434.1 putative alkaline shock family protein YloU [Kitasatospora sp. GP82]